MIAQPRTLSLPPWLRVALTVAGTLLLVAAACLLLRRSSRTAGDEPRSGVLGRAVLLAGSLAAHVPGLHRDSDGCNLPTRLAVAPGAWPARWISAGLQAAGRRGDTAHPPDLGRLAGGVRLLSATLSASPLAAACFEWSGATAAAFLGSAVLVAGSRLPDMTLAAAARRAVRISRHDVAATVDLLAATASAGLSLPEAMVLTAAHAPPALAAVLRAAAVRRALGDEPCEALTAEAHRYGLPVLGDVAQALERQRRLGVPLGTELSRIATRMRAEQRSAAMRRAARRGPLGTLVVALVIAPACLAAVVACLVGGLLEGGALPLR